MSEQDFENPLTRRWRTLNGHRRNGGFTLFTTLTPPKGSGSVAYADTENGREVPGAATTGRQPKSDEGSST